MKTFTAICAKNGQRIELTISKSTLEEARNEIHSQGYSIIELRESESVSTEPSGTVFYFEILLDGKKKSGQIRSSDMFRAYVKLTEGLHYEVVTIYEDPTSSEDEKRFLTNKVRQTYEVYKGQPLKKKEERETEKKAAGISGADLSEDSILMKRVAKYHVLIEKIIKKIEELLIKHASNLDENRIFLLKELINRIKLLKNLANPDKLYIVLEAALDKIGQLEIELVEKNLVSEKKEFFKGTNSLLKELGSSKKITLPEERFQAQAEILWRGIFEKWFSNPEKKPVATVWKPNDSDESIEFLYFKNVRELRAYEEKRKELRKELFRSFFTVGSDRKERMKWKLRLIEQNVELLRNRIKNRSNSYVRIKRGISAYSEALFYLLRSLGDFFLYSLLIYATAYAAYSSVLRFPDFPHRYAEILSFIAFSAFSLKQARSWLSFSLSFSAILAFFIFLGTNF